MTQRHLYPWLLAILLAAPLSLLAEPDSGALAKSAVLESNVAYLRVGIINPGLVSEIQSAQQALAATNEITGTVLDLRFVGGDDLDSAKALESVLEQEKSPLAVLVNDETTGAAQQLASDLRAAKAGLIFGSSKELTPDIQISVSADVEKHFMDNPYGSPLTNETGSVTGNNTASETNSADTNQDYLSYVDHTTEADLVREKIKDGLQENAFAPPAVTAPEQLYIRDPVLARGADFIKGLSALRLPNP